MDSHFNSYFWILSILTVVSLLFNIKKRRICFYISGFVNFCWAIVFYSAGIMPLAFLSIVYIVLAGYGLYEWRDPVGQSKGKIDDPLETDESSKELHS